MRTAAPSRISSGSFCVGYLVFESGFGDNRWVGVNFFLTRTPQLAFPRSEIQSALRGWELLLLGPAFVYGLAPAWWPRWLLMWSAAITMYAGCKWLLWRRTKAGSLSAWVAFLFAWPGMNPEEFGRPPAKLPRMQDWCFATGKLLFGLALFVWGGRLVEQEFLKGWLGMVGVVFVLHFGLFHVLSCFWRTWGFNARPLMDWPIASQSVSEFWGQRWNRAFRDLAHRFLFLPLSRRLGLRWGLWISFLVSGLIHDVVITIPAGGGYGGPTLFFLLQATGITIERSRVGQLLGLRRGWSGRMFTLLVLVAPVGLLFPPVFVLRVMVPFMQAVGASA